MAKVGFIGLGNMGGPMAGNLDIPEPCIRQVRTQHRFLDDPAERGRHGHWIGEDLRGQGAGAHEVGRGQPAARLEDAACLRECPRLVGGEIEGCVGRDRVGDALGERQSFHVGREGRDRGTIDPGHAAAEADQVLGRQIDGDDP